MNERFEALKADIAASLQRARFFYSNHRTLLLSGLTVLSILLIVWARVGFTLQFSRFYAADFGSCSVPNTTAECALGCSGGQKPGSNEPDTLGCSGGATCCINKPDGMDAGTFAASNGQWFVNGLYEPSCPSELPYHTERSDMAGAQYSLPYACVIKPQDCPEGLHAVGNSKCEGDGGGGGGGGGGTPTPPPPPGPTPGAGSLTLVTCAGGTVQLSWTIGANAIQNVLRRQPRGGSYELLGNVPGRTSYTETIPLGSTYIYSVKFGAGSASISNEVTCTYAAGTPVPTATPTPLPTATPTPNFPALQCAPINQTVALRQVATVTAVGGSGIYQWELSGSGIQEGGTSSSVGVSYSVAGQKVVRVTSAGQTATCVVTVTSEPAPTPTPIGIPSFSLAVIGRNVTTGGTQSAVVQALGGQQVEVSVRIINAQTTLNNVVVRAPLPAGLAYVAGSTSVAGTPTAVESITTGGLSLGTMGPLQETTVIFRARVVGTSFPIGTTQADMAVSVTADGTTLQSGTLAVVVTRAEAGVPSGVPTGPGDAVFAALLVSAIMTLLYVSYTHTAAYKRKEIEVITENRDPMDFRS